MSRTSTSCGGLGQIGCNKILIPTLSSVSIASSLIIADCIVGCCCCCCNSESVLSNELSLKLLKPFARFRPPEGTIDGNIDEVVRVGTDRDGTDRDGDDEIAVIDGDD